MLKKRSTHLSGELFYVCALPVLLIGGGFLCEGETPEIDQSKNSRTVAKVNQSVLSEEDLEDALLDFFGEFYTGDDKRDYIEQWIERELLYQRALEEGLQWDEDTRKKIVQFQRMLLEQEVLRRYLDGRIEISDEEISNYYTENAQVFICVEDEYRMTNLVFQSEEIAREVLGELTVAPERYEELITGEAYEGKITAIDLGFYPASGLKEVFGDQVLDLEVGQFSTPINTSPGNYYALRKDEYREKGSTRDLSEVEDLIRSILFRSKSERVKEEWLEELRARATIEVAAE